MQDNNPRSDLGYTPYQLAEQNGHFEICQLFDYQLLNPKRRKISWLNDPSRELVWRLDVFGHVWPTCLP